MSLDSLESLFTSEEDFRNHWTSIRDIGNSIYQTGRNQGVEEVKKNPELKKYTLPSDEFFPDEEDNRFRFGLDFGYRVIGLNFDSPKVIKVMIGKFGAQNHWTTVDNTTAFFRLIRHIDGK